MPPHKPLKVGQTRKFSGCFTEEYCIRGMTVTQIGKELGFLPYRMEKGIFVAFALQLPYYYQFDLAGWTEFPTNKFIDYDNDSKWDEDKFEETYAGIRMPISIEDAKMAWLKNMRKEKLVKILPVVPGQKGDDYPKGGKASQINVKPSESIECHVVKFLKKNETFKSVWT